MSRQIKLFYEFGPFRVDVENHLLLRKGEVVPLPPKAFDLLLALVEDSGRVIRKDELMKLIWPDTFVEEANLSYNVFTLRKALGDVSAGNGYIETIPRRGYRFTSGVTRITDEGADIVLAERSRAHVVIEEENETNEAPAQSVTLPAALQRARERGTAAAQRFKLQSRRLRVASAVIAIAAVVAVIYYVSRLRIGSRSDTKNVLAMKTIPLTTFADHEFEPALSPDGKLVAFAWTGGKGNQGENISIYVMQTGAGNTPLRLTTGVGRDANPTWSPDGSFIAFVRFSSAKDETGVYMVPALGGPKRRLLTKCLGGLSWSPDGSSLAFVDRNSPDEPVSVFLLSMDTLETRKLTSPPAGCFGDRYPVFSPDGQTLVFTRYVEWRTTGDLYVVPVGGGDARRVTFENRGLVGADWMPDGASIVFSSDRGGAQSLWRVSASGGEPARLEVDTENGYSPTISRQGNHLAYTLLLSDSNIYRIPIKGSKGHLPSSLIASSRKDKNPRISPDGKRIAFESDRAGTSEIWLADSDGSNQFQVTFFGGSITSNPSWSPDGRRLALNSRPEGHADIYTVDLEGGPPRRLTAGPYNCVAPSWSKNGQWLYFGSDRSGSWQVWKMPANGGDPLQLTTNGGYEAVESPDGQFVYYNKYGFYTVGLFRIPVEGGPEKRVLDYLPQLESFGDWEVTDEGIYFVNRYEIAGRPTNHPAIRFLSFATNSIVDVVTLEKDPGQHPGLNVSPDGQWLIYSRVDYSNHDIMLVENFH